MTFPTFSRIPGAEDVLDAGAFDAGEIAGMRSAGWILVASAGLGALGWLFRPGNPPIASAIDLFLGVQLLRLRHNWRAWAMFRAWIGTAIAVVLCAAALFGRGGAAAAALALAEAAYAASLLLLLFGTPSLKRVILGRIVFAASAVLMLLGIVLAAAAAANGTP